MERTGLPDGRAVRRHGADGHWREGELGEGEGLENSLEAGREGVGVGHPEYMLDSGWCRKVLLKNFP
jgi:hypothetical protein